MSAPAWAKNEQSIDDAKNYLRNGNSVDFFELVARGILQSHPSDVLAFCLELVTNLSTPGKEVPSYTEFQPRRTEDSPYMREHNVSELLDAWVLALLEARPAGDVERLAFHKRYLEGLIQQRDQQHQRQQQ